MRRHNKLSNLKLSHFHFRDGHKPERLYRNDTRKRCREREFRKYD